MKAALLDKDFRVLLGPVDMQWNGQYIEFPARQEPGSSGDARRFRLQFDNGEVVVVGAIGSTCALLPGVHVRIFPDFDVNELLAIERAHINVSGGQ